jgi:hypothetical protein
MMHIALKHNTSLPAAKNRIAQALQQAGPQMGEHVQNFEEHWEGSTLHFSFIAQGNKISGTCEVTDAEYVIDAKLPLMWRLFEGRIERMLQEEIAKQTK